MKTKVLSGFLLLFFSLFLVSFSDPYAIKRISDANFRYEFYTTDKKIKVKDHKIYYWFKGGAIHSAESGIAGTLLDDKFVIFINEDSFVAQTILDINDINELKMNIVRYSNINKM